MMSEAPNPAPEAAAPETPPVDAGGGLVKPGEGAPLGGAAASEAGDASQSSETGAAGNDSISGGEGNDSISGEAGELKVEDLKLPEGFEVDQAAMGEFTEFAKSAGLNQEQSQAALDLGMKMVQAQVEKLVNDQKETWTGIINGWKGELEKDPEFSGDNYKKSTTIIGRALDEFGDQAARDAFELTGAGWNPAIIRFVYKMAKALDEGEPAAGGKPASKSGEPKTLGSVLYGQNEGPQ